MSGVTVAWEDVFSVVSQIQGWLIGVAVVLIAMIAALVLAGRAGKGRAGFVRAQAVTAAVLAVCLLVNGILLGSMRSLVSTAMAETGMLSAQTVQNSKDICEAVASEGIVMTKNTGLLPLNGVTNLNVFGWASTNPVYGGTGSGTVDASTAVTLLGALENAGFALNSELSELYVNYRADRPAITINDGQEWTLPEPTTDAYANGILDTALIVIARCGGAIWARLWTVPIRKAPNTPAPVMTTTRPAPPMLIICARREFLLSGAFA